MKKSMLNHKIAELETWLKMNPNHQDFTAKKRQYNNLNQQLKQQQINEAFPA